MGLSHHGTSTSIMPSIDHMRIAVYLLHRLHDSLCVSTFIVRATGGVAASCAETVAGLVGNEDRYTLRDCGRNFTPDVAALWVAVGQDKDGFLSCAGQAVPDGGLAVMDAEIGAACSWKEAMSEVVEVAIVAVEVVICERQVQGGVVFRLGDVDIRVFI